jgi:(2Fe-2S) ferredoxin
VAARGLAAEVIDGACNGMCFAQVLVTVQREGESPRVYSNLSAESAASVLDGTARPTPHGD